MVEKTEKEFIIFDKYGNVHYTSNLKIKKSVSKPLNSYILKCDASLFLDLTEVFCLFVHDLDLHKFYSWYEIDNSFVESEDGACFYRMANIAVKRYVKHEGLKEFKQCYFS